MVRAPRETWSETALLPEPGRLVGSGTPTSPAGEADETSGEVLGYVLGEPLGVGGMGEVRAAHDPILRREVALKRLRHTDSGSIARFVAEAQVTAQLDHPNIVPVHALGTDAAGRPVLVMKRIQGRSLQELLETDAIDLHRRLDVFRRVCDAVAFAHARGVIHRDLKPENVMVGGFGEVLLVDWGLARPLGPGGVTGGQEAAPSLDVDRFEASAGRTRAGAVAGTPAYMAPEQAEGRVEALDARTDVYGLGAMLYALLTGSPPVTGPSEQVLERVRRGDVPRPSERAAVPRELEAVCLRAMALDPADRHPTAVAVREDIDAWLTHRPLVHVDSTLAERLGKWVERHRLAVRVALSIGGLAAALLLAGLVRYASDVGRARDQAFAEAERAREAEGSAKAELVRARVALSDSLVAQGEITAAGQALREADELVRSAAEACEGGDVPCPDVDRRPLDWALSAHAVRSPPPLATCHPHGEREVVAVALSDDGGLGASVDAQGGVRVWETTNCREVAASEHGPTDRAAIRFVGSVPEGVLGAATGSGLALRVLKGTRTVAVNDSSAAPAGSVYRITRDGARFVVALRDGSSAWVDAERAALVPVPGRVPGGAVSWPQGTLRLATSHPTGNEAGGAWGADGLARVALRGITDVAVTADGRWLALATAFGHQVRDLARGRGVSDLVWERAGRATGAIFLVEPAGRDALLFATRFEGALEVVRLRDGAPVAALEGDGSGVSRAFAVTPDASLVAMVGRGGALRVHALPRPMGIPLGQGGVPVGGNVAHALDVSPDGTLFAVGDDGGVLQIVERATRVVLQRWEGLAPGVRTVRFSPDGTRLLVAVRSGSVGVYPVHADGCEPSVCGEGRTWSVPGRAPAVDWIDATRAFVLDTDGGAWTLDAGRGALTSLGAPFPGGSSWDAVVIPGTTRVALGRRPLAGAPERAGLDAAVLLDVRDGRVLHEEPLTHSLYRTAVSPDGRILASGTHAGAILLWDAETGRALRSLPADGGPTLGVAFSPDGALLASTGFDGRVDLWDVARGERLRRMVAHQGPGAVVAFTPDGREVVSAGGEDRMVLLPLDGHRTHAAAVAALQGPLPGHADAWATLGLWSRVRTTLAFAGAGDRTDALRGAVERLERAAR